MRSDCGLIRCRHPAVIGGDRHFGELSTDATTFLLTDRREASRYTFGHFRLSATFNRHLRLPPKIVPAPPLAELIIGCQPGSLRLIDRDDESKGTRIARDFRSKVTIGVRHREPAVRARGRVDFRTRRREPKPAGRRVILLGSIYGPRADHVTRPPSFWARPKASSIPCRRPSDPDREVANIATGEIKKNARDFPSFPFHRQLYDKGYYHIFAGAQSKVGEKAPFVVISGFLAIARPQNPCSF